MIKVLEKTDGASIIEVDFTSVQSLRQLPSGNLQHYPDTRPVNEEGKLLTPKQIRARARRRAARDAKGKLGKKKSVISQAEFEALYKPVSEWDLQELAKGRPRNSKGNFSGRTPDWITPDVQEQAIGRFTDAIKGRMNELTIRGMDTIQWILEDNREDSKGRPVVPASTKLQAAQLMMEHLVGKPKQRIEQDISVKLQAILGSVMVNPNQALAAPSQGGTLGDSENNLPGYTVAHLPGHTIPMGVDTEVVDGEVVYSDE